jgi:hypothetical protein
MLQKFFQLYGLRFSVDFLLIPIGHWTFGLQHLILTATIRHEMFNSEFLMFNIQQKKKDRLLKAILLTQPCLASAG